MATCQHIISLAVATVSIYAVNMTKATFIKFRTTKPEAEAFARAATKCGTTMTAEMRKALERIKRKAEKMETGK